MNTCGLQDDIIMNKSCTDYIIVNKRVLTESACFKITNIRYQPNMCRCWKYFHTRVYVCLYLEKHRNMQSREVKVIYVEDPIKAQVATYKIKIPL